jgi:hypothetical protein
VIAKVATPPSRGRSGGRPTLVSHCTVVGVDFDLMFRIAGALRRVGCTDLSYVRIVAADGTFTITGDVAAARAEEWTAIREGLRVLPMARPSIAFVPVDEAVGVVDRREART